MVEKKYQLAERRLGAKKFEEAETLVQDSDRLIREFMLTDKLQRQVRMESKIDILREEQAQVDDLLREARTAISLGTLSQSDGQDHALSYLRRVLFKQPGNAEAGKMLTEIASLRQQAVYRALNNGELAQAQAYMRESDRLIKKYRLRDLRADQQAIEARYAATVNQNDGSAENIGSTQTGNAEATTLTPVQSDQQQANANVEAEAEAARQRQLQQQAAAEIARQRQLQEQANAEAEAARQRQLQQQAQQAEAARQRQLQQQAEVARQRQLQQQAQQAEAEAARQRQIQIQQQQSAARQRQLQQQQAAARQRQIQLQQQEAARQRQLQQQQAALQQQRQQQQIQTQTVDGYIIDEDGFVIGEPPIADGYVEGMVEDSAQVIAIPVQRIQPNEVDLQAIPNGSPQAVPVWEDQTLQQNQPVGAAAVNTQPQQPGLQTQFDNFQAQANAVNVPFTDEEALIPELQEVPLSVIEEILPGQAQQ